MKRSLSDRTAAEASSSSSSSQTMMMASFEKRYPQPQPRSHFNYEDYLHRNVVVALEYYNSCHQDQFELVDALFMCGYWWMYERLHIHFSFIGKQKFPMKGSPPKHKLFFAEFYGRKYRLFKICTIVEPEQFKIGLCQLSVHPDKTTNLTRAQNAIELASKGGAKLVVLPEMWNCPYSSDYFMKFAEDFRDKDESRSFFMLSELASSQGITIIGGSIPELSNGHLYNTCCVFGPDGNLKAKHRKLHLFDINVPGEISFKESDSFAAGDRATVVDTDMGRIGIGICHDIRFPELAMLYRARGVHLICYPGAFNMSTGILLWELEQRARAADNQVYIASCSPSRHSAGSYTIWGHSTVVGPSGEVIASTGHEEAVVIAEIDCSAIIHQREILPLEKQMHQDWYQLVDAEEEQSS